MLVVEERSVGPGLGSDSVRAGQVASIVGLAGVALFMISSYGMIGCLAVIAVFINMLLLYGQLSILGATLTLPGIAGIVLTIGMAVDANVLIFERIKEEMGSNKNIQKAISSGYEKALLTIADANITTLIASVVLFSFGTGPIKGFAVTLSIGIITSMFTAIIVSRAIINLIYGGKKVEELAI